MSSELKPFDVESVLSQMTVEEKISLLVGASGWTTSEIARLNVPSVVMYDGPNGLGKVLNGEVNPSKRDIMPATCFPTLCLMASTWNREMMTRVAKAIGEECSCCNVDCLLGPGVCMKRSPLCGRNFEYFSEDPYLAGEMAVAYVRGLQGEGVGATVKHYCANNQEHYRMTVNEIIDERTLREIYLPAFEKAVKEAQPYMIMSSYNYINGEHTDASRKLLTDILRNEWGYEGIVVSDWGAVENRTKAIEGGLDLQMPGPDVPCETRVLQHAQCGKLNMNDLNVCAKRMLRFVNRVIQHSRPKAAQRQHAPIDFMAHNSIAQEAAADGMILLKNEHHILPLHKNKKVCVIGALACQPRFQGGGSSTLNPVCVSTPLDGMKQVNGAEHVVYAPGYNLESKMNDDSEEAQQAADHLIHEAVQAARHCPTAVIYVGYPMNWGAEGDDRANLYLPPEQDKLVKAVCQVNKHVVVVLMTFSACVLPWMHEVEGILLSYLPGQACGGAIAQILFGEVCPSGKLTETFPQRLEDTPCYLDYPGHFTVTYSERIYIGYRYYDTRKIDPLFPFGFGLSYTTFDYSQPEVDKTSCTDTDTIQASVTVKNTGNVAGAQVVQLYVKDCKSTIDRPEKELKGFAKVFLQPGESQRVCFTLDKRSFAYYDVEQKDWVVEDGEFVIMFAASSRDIRQEVSVHVTPCCVAPFRFTADTPVDYIYTLPNIKKIKNAILQPVLMHGQQTMFKQMPIRTLVAFAGGKYTYDQLDELIDELNEMSGAKAIAA